jgi:hypothetical protein
MFVCLGREHVMVGHSQVIQIPKTQRKEDKQVPVRANMPQNSRKTPALSLVLS